jgi:hypothetical protein
MMSNNETSLGVGDVVTLRTTRKKEWIVVGFLSIFPSRPEPRTVLVSRDDLNVVPSGERGRGLEFSLEEHPVTRFCPRFVKIRKIGCAVRSNEDARDLFRTVASVWSSDWSSSGPFDIEIDDSESVVVGRSTRIEVSQTVFVFFRSAR